MTISSTISRWEYTGDGSTTDFTYSNKIFVNTELEVYSDNVLQTLATDYTVSGVGQVDGGTVTYLAAPANDVSVVIVRVVPDTQPSDYPLGGAFPSTTLEDDLDRRTIVSQQQQETLDRTIKSPSSEAQVDMTLPVLATRASKYSGFDSDGKPVELDAPANTTAVTTFSAAQLLLADAATWLTGLGVSTFIQTLLDDVDAAAARTTLAAAGNPLTKVLDTGGFAINESEATPVASAATTNIWATDGNTIHVTGTDAITSFGTAPNVGAWRKVIFDDALTLTDGANLNLPGAANITTAADDFAFVYAETTTLFKVLYFKADGTAVSSTPVDIQTFTGNGTWTKPSGGQKTTKVLVWSPGGSGAVAATAADGAGGGGGGGFDSATFDIDDLGATEAITVPAGGAAVSTDDTSGNDGAGNASFGIRIVVTPGKAGVYDGNPAASLGGDGGGLVNAQNSDFGGGVGTANAGESSVRGGAAGGGGGNAGPYNGGDGDDGGGGGAGTKDSDGNGTGGTSKRAGNGGASADGGNGTAGTTPSGGGGAAFGTGNSSGKGGDGKIIVISW